MENGSIKQALFPPCGPNASTAEGGGQKKVHALWQLCKLVLGDDEKYKDALAEAENNTRDRTGWSIRFKNRVRV